MLKAKDAKWLRGVTLFESIKESWICDCKKGVGCMDGWQGGHATA